MQRIPSTPTTTTHKAVQRIALLALLLFLHIQLRLLRHVAAVRPSSTTLRILHRIDYRMHNGRTINDIAAAPFMVYVTVRNKDSTSVCGGCVIAERRVVTAAHCVAKSLVFGLIRYHVDPDSVVLKAGTADRQARDGDLRGLILTHAERVIVHPGYRSAGQLRHDIAVIVPKERLYTLNSGTGDAGGGGGGVEAIAGLVRPIAMPRDAAAPGANCSVTGWGRTKAGVLPQWLQQSDCEVVERSACRRALGVDLEAEHLCVMGREDTTVDQGDSGGPLVCGGGGGANGTAAYLTGVVSFGSKESSGSKPNVFTSVWEERDFVLNGCGRMRWGRRSVVWLVGVVGMLVVVRFW